MTNKSLNIEVGDTIIVNTADAVYEGEVLAINEKQLTMTYFNRVKDEEREVEIPLDKIQSIEEDI